MTADWSVEAANDSPTIELPWSGWVDLSWDLKSRNPERLWNAALALTLPEVAAYPELLAPLQILNRRPLLTAKLDVFPATRDQADPDLLLTIDEPALLDHGLGSYLDVLTPGIPIPKHLDNDRTIGGAASHGADIGRNQEVFSVYNTKNQQFDHFRTVAKQVAHTLNTISTSPAQAEIVVRPAHLYSEETYGYTLYSLGFGRTPAQARESWQAASAQLATAFLLTIQPFL